MVNLSIIAYKKVINDGLSDSVINFQILPANMRENREGCHSLGGLQRVLILFLF